MARKAALSMGWSCCNGTIKHLQEKWIPLFLTEDAIQQRLRALSVGVAACRSIVGAGDGVGSGGAGGLEDAAMPGVVKTPRPMAARANENIESLTILHLPSCSGGKCRAARRHHLEDGGLTGKFQSLVFHLCLQLSARRQIHPSTVDPGPSCP